MRSKERWIDEAATGGDEAKIWIWISIVGVLIIAGLITGIVYTCRMQKGKTSANSKLAGAKNANNDWQLYGAPKSEEKQNPLAPQW